MIASMGRTIIMVLALFAVLAGINMLGRAATPAVGRVSPKLGGIFDFVF